MFTTRQNIRIISKALHLFKLNITHFPFLVCMYECTCVGVFPIGLCCCNYMYNFKYVKTHHLLHIIASPSLFPLSAAALEIYDPFLGSSDTVLIKLQTVCRLLKQLYTRTEKLSFELVLHCFESHEILIRNQFLPGVCCRRRQKLRQLWVGTAVLGLLSNIHEDVGREFTRAG